MANLAKMEFLQCRIANGLANIPIILESGNLDENGENLLSMVNLAKKSPKV